MNANEMKIRGNHNVANALAALALGEAVGLPMDAMLDTLRQFAGLAHRCQFVAEQTQVSYYNDSKGTNVGATVAAIEGLGGSLVAHQGRVVVILGGVGKGQDFSPLVPALQRYGRSAVLIGEDAAKIAQQIAGAVDVWHADSLADALAQARQQAVAGDAVLLSPACASFDMFLNYEDRGDQFVACVQGTSS